MKNLFSFIPNVRFLFFLLLFQWMFFLTHVETQLAIRKETRLELSPLLQLLHSHYTTNTYYDYNSPPVIVILQLNLDTTKLQLLHTFLTLHLFGSSTNRATVLQSLFFLEQTQKLE